VVTKGERDRGKEIESEREVKGKIVLKIGLGFRPTSVA
jgi:hypothetical protein